MTENTENKNEKWTYLKCVSISFTQGENYLRYAIIWQGCLIRNHMTLNNKFYCFEDSEQ